MSDLKELLAKCLPVIAKAGEIVKRRWNSDHEIRHKGAIDLVTETDREVEEFLHAALLALTPDAAFVGEESAADTAALLAAPSCWIVDPVDGTTNFVHRIPMVGVSVAFCLNGKPVLGVVDAPMLAERYYALKDGGAFLNGAPIAVSKADKLSSCLVATGFPYDVPPKLPAIIRRLEAVLPATQGLRRPGAASIDLAWVGCGRLDAFYEDGLKPWDMAAGIVIVEAAGGQTSDFNGGPSGWGKSLLATNGIMQPDFVKLLADKP